eukprot:15440237-Alexandrium_andersonii.AAC.1
MLMLAAVWAKAATLRGQMADPASSLQVKPEASMADDDKSPVADVGGEADGKRQAMLALLNLKPGANTKEKGGDPGET